MTNEYTKLLDKAQARHAESYSALLGEALELRRDRDTHSELAREYQQRWLAVSTKKDMLELVVVLAWLAGFIVGVLSMWIFRVFGRG